MKGQTRVEVTLHITPGDLQILHEACRVLMFAAKVEHQKGTLPRQTLREMEDDGRPKYELTNNDPRAMAVRASTLMDILKGG